MKVGNYKVFWKHARSFDVGRDSVNVLPNGGRTHCIIEDENRNELAKATTQCSIQDNYDKNLGRKLSMQRALKNLGLSKNERRKFFDTYFEVIGK